MADYYRANPKEMPQIAPEDISVETSQLQLATYFGVNLDDIKRKQG